MNSFSYSVAVRTLGTAGEKYQKLLNSIANQTIQPEKIVVVLPEGYNPPKEQLGSEEFVFCKKGMVIQRLEALKYIDSEYVLFTDDDIEFESTYIEKLKNSVENGYSCAAGPLLELLPPDNMKYFFASILGGACVMFRGKEKYYIRILRTGGWSYHHIDTTENKIYETESLPWANFLISKNVMHEIAFEDELWVEKTGYSAFEDRVMFYKLIKNGYRIGVVADAHYMHNDAKSSFASVKLEPIYAAAFNHYVFWHRFLYSLSKNPIEKLWMKICISYYIGMGSVYGKLLMKSGRRTKEQNEASQKGFTDAKNYVKSQEYQNLPKVIQRM